MSRHSARQELASLLGVPVTPPGRATKALTAARRGMTRLHRSSGPPPVQVLEALFGLFDNRVLGLMVELDIPDRLDQPRSVIELAGERASPTQLDRVLRYAVGRGFLSMDKAGTYRANGVTEVLRSDHPNSWRGWVEFASSDWFWDACRRVDSAVSDEGISGIAAATGHDFFEFIGSVRPDAGAAFHAAMRSGATVQALGLAGTLQWDDIHTVCDVGGGTGAAVAALLEHHGHLTAAVFDLPDVVAHLEQAAADGRVAARVEAIGGDFFAEIPAGFDRYLLLAVIHDWDDDQDARILSNLADAMSPYSDAVVVETPLTERPRDSFEAASDMLMLALAAGRERTDHEYCDLFTGAGLDVADKVALPTGATAFRLVRRPG